MKVASLILLFVCFNFCSAGELMVFREGHPAPNYDSLISNVHQGDSIVIEEAGKKTVFHIKAQLYPGPNAGDGSTNIIFETADGKALRMANRTENLESITDYILGYKDLEKNHIKFTNVDLNKSVSGEFVVQEKLNIEFSLRDFLKSPTTDAKFRGVDTGTLKSQLSQFAETLAGYEDIGDFELTQVGWVKGKWVLFDYGYPHYLADEQSTETVFSRYARAKITNLSPDGKSLMQEMDARMKLKRQTTCLVDALETIH